MDGVQRIDGDFTNDDGETLSQGRFLSMAAGMVYCNGAARIDTSSVQRRRILLALPPMADVDCGQGVLYECSWVKDVSDQTLMLETHRLREHLEVAVAKASPPAELVVIDGHLQHREDVENAVGYLKTQRQRYLPMEQHALIRRLAPGERTPVFLIKEAGTLLLVCAPAPQVRPAPSWHRPLRGVRIADRRRGGAARQAGLNHGATLRKRTAQGRPRPSEPLPHRRPGARPPPPPRRSGPAHAQPHARAGDAGVDLSRPPQPSPAAAERGSNWNGT